MAWRRVILGINQILARATNTNPYLTRRDRRLTFVKRTDLPEPHHRLAGEQPRQHKSLVHTPHSGIALLDQPLHLDEPRVIYCELPAITRSSPSLERDR